MSVFVRSSKDAGAITRTDSAGRILCAVFRQIFPKRVTNNSYKYHIMSMRMLTRLFLPVGVAFPIPLISTNRYLWKIHSGLYTILSSFIVVLCLSAPICLTLVCRCLLPFSAPRFHSYVCVAVSAQVLPSISAAHAHIATNYCLYFDNLFP